MTNVILIPEKQIILIHPEWSAILTSLQPSSPQAQVAWGLKAVFHILSMKNTRKY